MKTAARAPATLIAVDGIDWASMLAAAGSALTPRARGGISRWDASGVFQDLAAAGPDAGAPSARTLLLLYAADLAFRLRWQIRPALAEGRTVVAVPYVATAIAVGRAVGLPATWLAGLFAFAPRPDSRRVVHPSRDAPPAAGARDGFAGFVCERMATADRRASRRLLEETAARLSSSRSRMTRRP